MREESVKATLAIADKFVEWQDEEGGLSDGKSGYHKPWPFKEHVLHPYSFDLPFVSHMLYRVYEFSGDEKYKNSADGYARYVVTETPEPQKSMPKATYQYGIALWSYAQFKKANPKDTSLDEVAKDLYRLLLSRRVDRSPYFTLGYSIGPNPNYPVDVGKDCAFSNDLTLVGLGLMGYFRAAKSADALFHAIGLSRYFTTEYEPGTDVGVWCSPLGTWLIGPWKAIGFEILKKVYSNEAGITYNGTGVDYLIQLYEVTCDPKLRYVCLSHLAWSLDKCQFDDGAIGIHGRDDKWVGPTAQAVSQYARFKKLGMMDKNYISRHKPKVLKALEFLRTHSLPDQMPRDAYIKVTGESVPEPDVEVVWALSWTAEGLLDSLKLKECSESSCAI